MEKIKGKKEVSSIFEMDSSQEIMSINNLPDIDISNMISVENMIALKEKSARIARGIVNGELPMDIFVKEEKSIHKINVDKVIINKAVDSKRVLKLTSTEETIINQTINKTNTNKENIAKISNIDVLKESLIAQLEAAQTDHLNYIKNIYVFLQLDGNVTNSQLIEPINYTMCTFGKWYYGKGQSFNKFDEFNKAESLHVIIHNYYLKIYKLYSITLKSSFFKTIERLEKERLKKVEKLVVILESNSNELIGLLDKIIIKIKNMNPKELESIIV